LKLAFMCYVGDVVLPGERSRRRFAIH
jgi:hypothetical protein